MLLWQELGGKLYIEVADTRTYLNAIEEWLATGEYGNLGYQEGRIPGYGAVYLLFRAWLPTPAAQTALVLLQILLSVLSTHLLGLLAVRAAGKDMAYWAVAIPKLLYLPLVKSALYLQTESLAVSLSLISLYLFVQAVKAGQTPRSWQMLGTSAGVAALTVFIKPVFLPFFALFGLAWLWGKISFARLALFATLLALPLAGWTLRNYLKYNKFILLQSSVYYNSTRFDSQNLVQSSSPGKLFYGPLEQQLPRYLMDIGADITWWNPEARELRWLLGSSPVAEFPFASWQLSTTGNDRLLLDSLRMEIAVLLPQQPDTVVACQRLHRVNRLTAQLRQNRLADWNLYRWIRVKTRLALAFVSHSGTVYLWGQAYAELNPLKKALKWLSSGLYVAILAGFGLVLVAGVALRHKPDWLMALVALLGVYLLAVYPLGFHLVEYRYIETALPFLLWVVAVAGVMRFPK
jgi:hypothetical protein